MRKLTALFIASTLAFGGTTMAFAADDATAPTAATAAPATDTAPTKMMRHKGHGKEGHGKGGLFAGLNLTEQQRQQVRDIMKESQQNFSQEAKGQRQALHSLVASESFDEAKVKAEIDAISKVHTERMLQRAKAENKVYNLLTAEQKKQYNENYQKREQEMMEHMEKMKEKRSADQ
ncbi:ATP-independent periplasmic protein-refolding chaperone Spy [Serratia sp. DD3]|uniref:ATP-independent periplasmic protein-refolding chaperone Spy n=1 Tax=Serratia sp. DD3 TaxID=1410619 RepID=UPI0003C51416|nr:ATP-independent periplasmic protein-refolding chaperone Spy [Serratia sp. DD3]KEY58118.1 spheroplast protein Y [Serratia sp. DD3]